MWEFILDAVEALFDFIDSVISWIIDGLISLLEHVTNYFRGLKLKKGRDIPFIADQRKLGNIIHQAPQKNVGIFEGTYNEDTNEIENYRLVEADGMSEDVKDLLGKEKLVVLT